MIVSLGELLSRNNPPGRRTISSSLSKLLIILLLDPSISAEAATMTKNKCESIEDVKVLVEDVVCSGQCCKSMPLMEHQLLRYETISGRDFESVLSMNFREGFSLQMTPNDKDGTSKACTIEIPYQYPSECRISPKDIVFSYFLTVHHRHDARIRLEVYEKGRKTGRNKEVFSFLFVDNSQSTALLSSSIKLRKSGKNYWTKCKPTGKDKAVTTLVFETSAELKPKDQKPFYTEYSELKVYNLYNTLENGRYGIKPCKRTDMLANF